MVSGFYTDDATALLSKMCSFGWFNMFTKKMEHQRMNWNENENESRTKQKQYNELDICVVGGGKAF